MTHGEEWAFAKIEANMGPEPPTDGYDTAPRSWLPELESAEPPEGHIALVGDFPPPEPEA